MTEQEKQEKEDRFCRLCSCYPLCEIDIEKCCLINKKNNEDSEEQEFKDKAILGINHNPSEDKTDCIFYSDTDSKCHFAILPTYCTGECGAYQSDKMCGTCIHFSECNADITGEVCERYEVEE